MENEFDNSIRPFWGLFKSPSKTSQKGYKNSSKTRPKVKVSKLILNLAFGIETQEYFLSIYLIFINSQFHISFLHLHKL